MKKTTKILVDEHKNILKVAEALIKKSQEAETGKLDVKFFKEAVEFIRNYADKFHHAKEEDILFKELNKSAEEGCLHCNPVNQMLIEHEQGRAFVKAISDGIKENNAKKVSESARGYANLIQEHIFKEDNILYPMADETLDKGVQTSMLKKFQEIGRKNKEAKKYEGFAESLK